MSFVGEGLQGSPASDRACKGGGVAGAAGQFGPYWTYAGQGGMGGVPAMGLQRVMTENGVMLVPYGINAMAGG